jgi:hypothetical protein
MKKTEFKYFMYYLTPDKDGETRTRLYRVYPDGTYAIWYKIEWRYMGLTFPWTGKEKEFKDLDNITEITEEEALLEMI